MVKCIFEGEKKYQNRKTKQHSYRTDIPEEKDDYISGQVLSTVWCLHVERTLIKTFVFCQQLQSTNMQLLNTACHESSRNNGSSKLATILRCRLTTAIITQEGEG